MRHDIVSDASEVVHSGSVAGKAVKLSVHWAAGSVVEVVGVHNFGMQATELRRVARVVQAIREEVEAGLASRFPIVVGDWNFLRDCEGYMSVAAPKALVRMPSARRSGQNFFQPILDGLVEVHQERPTHVGVGGSVAFGPCLPRYAGLRDSAYCGAGGSARVA